MPKTKIPASQLPAPDPIEGNPRKGSNILVRWGRGYAECEVVSFGADAATVLHKKSGNTANVGRDKCFKLRGK